MRIIVDNMLRLQDIPDEILEQIKSELTIKNPEHAKKKAMGLNRWAWGPEYIKLWTEKTVNGRKQYIIPRGYFARMWEIASKVGKGLLHDERLKLPQIAYPKKPQLRDYQAPAVELAKLWQQGVVIMPCGSGKGHPLNTKIYTPDGPVEFGTLSAGDKVIGSDGRPITVTGIFDRGMLPTYRVTFSDDTSLLCDGDHIFAVQSQSVRNTTGNWITKTVKELLDGKLYCGTDEKHNRKKWFIPIVKPVQFTPKKVLIDPYFLGAWLGDGCTKKGHIFITNAEPDIIGKLKKIVQLSQYEYNEFGVINAAEYEKELKRLGLSGKESHEKFIPAEYLYNSVDVRLSVLQGLMDTDGSIEKCNFSITTTSKRMASEILEIVQSLGGTGKISKRQTFFTNYGYKKAGMKSYRVSFKLREMLPFTSKKHSSKYVPPTKYKKVYRGIKSIEYVGDMPIRCIAVDAPDKLYVVENYIVTHNTETAMGIVAELGQPTLWVTHTMDLLKQSMDRAISRLGLIGRQVGIIQGENMSIGSHMTFATVQTLAKRDLSEIKKRFGCVIVDEAHLVFKDDKKFRMFADVINQLPAYYRFGLTASEHRSDGLIETMFHIIGPKIYEVAQDDPRLPVMKPRVEFIETDFEYETPEGEMLNIQQLYKAMREDLERDYPILWIMKNCIRENNSCLALGDSLEHLTRLTKLAKDHGFTAVFVCGETPKREREKIMADMRAGKYQFLFATYQLAKLGLDIPRLDRLILITPHRDKTSIQQAVGRIMRPYEGKSQPVVYDIYDSKVRQMVFWARERVRVYRQLGCEVVGGPKVRRW